MKITSSKGFKGIDERIKLSQGISTATEITDFKITDDGSISKTPDHSLVSKFLRRIDALWCGSVNGYETIAVVSEGILYNIPASDYSVTPEPLGEVGLGECLMFGFNNRLYIKTPSTYDVYDGQSVQRVEGYIPTVAINCGKNGDGEIFEQLNLLTDKRKQLVSPDGVSTQYKIVEDKIDEVLSVTIDGKEYAEGFLYDPSTNFVNFINPPPEGLNTLTILYRKHAPEEERKRILKCTRIMFFGGNSNGRAFLYGNPDYPNYRFHSELANGVPNVEYFPVNAFTIIGDSKINCIVQQYDRQLIFSENQAYYSYSELRQDALGNTISSYPVYSLNGSKGCILETDGCIMENRPVTLCDDGLNMWESTSVVNEKNAICFSSPIDESMSRILSGDKSNLKLFDFQANRELYLICDGIAYIYNYGNGNWYTYTNFHCEHFAIYNNTLYYSNDNMLYLTKNTNPRISIKPRIYKSTFITNGQNTGRADIVSFDADLYVLGPVEVVFGFEKQDGTIKERKFKFREGEKGFIRITLRPALKRAMPFRFIYQTSGYGESVLHGVSITTREKERSSRRGIL